MTSSAMAGYMQDEIVRPNHEAELLACRNLLDSLYKPCFDGILWGFSAHGEPKKEHMKSLNFCHSELLSAEEKDICYSKSISYFNSYERSPAELKQVCQEVEEGYKRHCLNG